MDFPYSYKKLISLTSKDLENNRDLYLGKNKFGHHIHIMPNNMYKIDPWFRFDFRNEEDRKLGSKNNDVGWKIHISVSSKDLEKAWDSIYSDIIEAQVFTKVASPRLFDGFDNPMHIQAGKYIVLYGQPQIEDKDHKKWETLCSIIEDKLRRNNIAFGWPVKGDRPIDGSFYMHYRSDQDINGNYASSSDGDGYNIANNEKGFDFLKISSKEKPPVFFRSTKILDIYCLMLSGGIWENHGNEYVSHFKDTKEASLFARSLNSANIKAVQKGKDIFVSDKESKNIQSFWFHASEVRKTADFGLALKEDIGNDVSLSVINRKSDSLSPFVKISMPKGFDSEIFLSKINHDKRYAIYLQNTEIRPDHIVMPYSGYDHSCGNLVKSGYYKFIVESLKESIVKTKSVEKDLVSE